MVDHLTQATPTKRKYNKDRPHDSLGGLALVEARFNSSENSNLELSTGRENLRYQVESCLGK